MGSHLISVMGAEDAPLEFSAITEEIILHPKLKAPSSIMIPLF